MRFLAITRLALVLALIMAFGLEPGLAAGRAMMPVQDHAAMAQAMRHAMPVASPTSDDAAAAALCKQACQIGVAAVLSDPAVPAASPVRDTPARPADAHALSLVRAPPGPPPKVLTP